MFHLNPKPSPPTYVGFDTPGHAVDSSAAEITPVREFIKNNFSIAWADEVSVGFANKPITLFIATRDARVIGFAAYECTRKAFFGHVPFPLVHVDTTYKIPSMIEYRDRLVRDWNLKLIVGKNEKVLKEGRTYPNGRATRVAWINADAPHQVLQWDNGSTVFKLEPTR